DALHLLAVRVDDGAATLLNVDLDGRDLGPRRHDLRRDLARIEASAVAVGAVEFQTRGFARELVLDLVQSVDSRVAGRPRLVSGHERVTRNVGLALSGALVALFLLPAR